MFFIFLLWQSPNEERANENKRKKLNGRGFKRTTTPTTATAQIKYRDIFSYISEKIKKDESKKMKRKTKSESRWWEGEGGIE